jgi:nucleoside-diphosphate-sugar epimerase
LNVREDFLAEELLRVAALPTCFRDVDDLEDWMTKPHRCLVNELDQVDGDIMVLGVSGKMGPTLARLAKRAAPRKRVIGVARFRNKEIRERLEKYDVVTIACDLLDREALGRLPDAPNVIFMAGLAGSKFGLTGTEPLLWATNAYVAGLVSERFSTSRLVVFSTGCVYPFVSISSGGATESAPPAPPASEYANSCVARERIFQHFSGKYHTLGRIVRLNYAIDMRYGVLHDLARKVMARAPIDLTTGHFNAIWQGDANAMSLRCLRYCTTPISPINISGRETISVRAVADAFGAAFGRRPVFVGTEANNSWLTDSSLAMRTFGYPQVTLQHLISWTIDWVMRDLPSLGKRTYYEVRG